MKADGLEIHSIPHLSIYLRGEKKKPRHFVDEIDVVKMWKFVWAYFEGKVSIPAFSESEVEEIQLELLPLEDQLVLFTLKINFDHRI